MKFRAMRTFLAGFLSAILASAAAAIAEPAHRKSDFLARNSDFFNPRRDASYEDSLKALGLSTRPPIYVPPHWCPIVFTVESIEAPGLDTLSFYQSADLITKQIYEYELSVLNVSISRILAGDCPPVLERFYTIAPTTIRGCDIAGERRQKIYPGAEVVGVLSWGGPGYGGAPRLGSYFVFGTPGTDHYLGYLDARITSLFKRHAQQYQRPREPVEVDRNGPLPHPPLPDDSLSIEKTSDPGNE